MRWPSFLRIIAAVLVVAALVVTLLVAYSRVDPLGFSDHKRDFRLALGLPKNWATGFNTNPRGYVAAKCPGPSAIVIVTGGQSNAANALTDPLPADPSAQAYMVQAGQCWRLRDPVLGATGRNASLWTELGSALFQATGRPVVFVNGGVGGSQLGDWLDDRSGYRQRLAANIAGARRAGLDPDFVLWVQGETDSAVLLPPNVFVDQLKDLIARFDRDGSTSKTVPWVVYRSTHCMERRNNGAAIDKAVTEFAATSDRVIAGPRASALGPDQRWDGCHFNGRGRAALTAEVLPILLAQIAPAR